MSDTIPTYLIKNARLVNEGRSYEADVLLSGGRIERVDGSISPKNNSVQIVDGGGKLLIPGVIDTQVHFREPGLTHKADLTTESMAAVAGGVTSFIEQPNTVPAATTLELLEAKFNR
ncbi:MAG: dihydroorotase, partial [Schleiferiaceae bacterium]